VAEEDKAGENLNLNCGDLINISMYADIKSMIDEDIIVDIQMVDTRNNERENSPIHYVIILRRAGKAKMKPRLKMNKYGLSCKKTKMKTSVTKLFHVLIVSLARLKMNKYGLSCKKTKMKTSFTKLFHALIVSVADTRPACICYFSVLFLH